MQFQLVITDELDVAILHDILIHLIRDHPPLQMNVVVELDSNGCTWIDSSSTCSQQLVDPISSSTNDLVQNTEKSTAEDSTLDPMPSPKNILPPNTEQDQPDTSEL